MDVVAVVVSLYADRHHRPSKKGSKGCRALYNANVNNPKTNSEDYVYVTTQDDHSVGSFITDGFLFTKSLSKSILQLNPMDNKTSLITSFDRIQFDLIVNCLLTLNL